MVKDNRDAFGFSEAALRGLEDLDRRTPPPEIQETWAKPKHRSPKGPNQHHTIQAHYWGHRERLRNRFLADNGTAMPDYEILELILFDSIPRIDVKPIAKSLLAVFGDLNGVIAAPKERLLELPKVTEKVFYRLRLFAAVAGRMARAKVMDRSVLSSWTELMTYCKTVMAHRSTEAFRVLYLDRKNVLIGDEAQADGTIDHVPVYPREVVKRALAVDASAIILVHNHPSGDPTPSRADIQMTSQVAAACKAVGIKLHDHVIIGKERDLSFRTTGLI